MYRLAMGVALVVIVSFAAGVASAQPPCYGPPAPAVTLSPPAPLAVPYMGNNYSFYPRSYQYYPGYSAYYPPAAAAPVVTVPSYYQPRYENPGPYYYTPTYSYTPSYYGFYYTPGYFRY